MEGKEKVTSTAHESNQGNERQFGFSGERPKFWQKARAKYVENPKNQEFALCQLEEESSEGSSRASEDGALESDLLDILETLPLGMNEELPDWFKEFFHLYKFNERRKFLMLRQMHLQMIDFEIKKCELLKDIIEKLKN